jgi:hypothetical protein
VLDVLHGHGRTWLLVRVLLAQAGAELLVVPSMWMPLMLGSWCEPEAVMRRCTGWPTRTVVQSAWISSLTSLVVLEPGVEDGGGGGLGGAAGCDPSAQRGPGDAEPPGAADSGVTGGRPAAGTRSG